MRSAIDGVPSVTADEMREVDRLMVEEYRIDLRRMMELAGRHLASLARRRMRGLQAGRRSIVVLAGPGGNGGGAMVAARRLHGWGYPVTVFLPSGAQEGVPNEQLAILRAVGIPTIEQGDLPGGPADFVIDGLIGYGLHGAPVERTRECIEWANARKVPVLSLDLPSGLHPDTGEALGATVRASATLTLGLPKTGLLASVAREWVGALYVGDIGIPPGLYERLPLGVPVLNLFARTDIRRLY